MQLGKRGAMVFVFGRHDDEQQSAKRCADAASKAGGSSRYSMGEVEDEDDVHRLLGEVRI